MTIFEGYRLMAIIRDYHGSEPEVERFDGPRPPKQQPLTGDQKLILDVHETIGHLEALHRLIFLGPYTFMREIYGRLGSDAIGELARIIEAGELPATGPADPTAPA